MGGRVTDRLGFEAGVLQPLLKPVPVSCDRRNTSRYPIELRISYEIHKGRRIIQAGAGTTINLSRAGILLRSDRLLPVLSNARISIDWPFLLNDACGLQLIALTKVLRSDQSGTALKIIRYEFRTCAVSRAPVSNSRSLGRTEAAGGSASD
jgi:hypothetical protein